MDVQNLSSLITAFRAETSTAALTPESIGALLQKIVDVLALASEQTDLALIERWKAMLQNSGFVNIGISPGYADSKSLYLSEKRLSLADGSAYTEPDSILLQQASTERAGIMGTQHVKDINALKSTISEMSPELERFYSQLSYLVLDVKVNRYSSYKYSNGFTPSGSQTENLYLHVFFKNNSISSSKINMPDIDVNTRLWHLTCNTHGGVLYLNHGYDLIKLGYKPYIFRWTLKRNKIKDPDKIKKYIRGPKKHGWHMFHSQQIVKVDSYDSSVYFSRIDSEGQLSSYYETHPGSLMTVDFRYKDSEIYTLRVGFGKKTIEAINGRRFKFGIAFANSTFKEGFDYSSLVTNIAPFYVHVRLNDRKDGYDTEFCL